ncbi:MAG: YfiR family protein [Planctomycetales bacterium]|nr:YfiR family protein [Planctomycetales bacterium]
MRRFSFVMYLQSGLRLIAAPCAVSDSATSTLKPLFSQSAKMLLAVVITSLSIACHADAQTAVIDREYGIKAAFLYQFSKYVQWPKSAFAGDDDAFVIGIYKTNPFDATLQKVAATKKFRNRPIAIQVVTEPSEGRNCHILFVSSAVAPEERTRVIKAARDAAVLIVGESDGFVRQGGDAQFFLEDNKVRFAIQNQSRGQRGLTVSSKLLALSRPAPETQ